VSATTLTFAFFSLNNWTGKFESLNTQSIGVAFIFAIVIYFISTFLKINMGTCYPTDCIISLGPIVFIIFLHWAIHEIVKVISACPLC